MPKTKEAIFNTFIEMTSSVGYENVGMRDIAQKININAASMYYHFPSKAKMLEHAYDYYVEHQYDTRRPVADMCALIETAPVEKLIPAFFFTFEGLPPEQYMRMILITKIIYMRLYQDPLANKIFQEGDQDNHKYLVEILSHGQKVGRVKPDFDIDTFSDVLIGSLQIMGVKAFAQFDYEVGQLEQEKRILALLTRLLATGLTDR